MNIEGILSLVNAGFTKQEILKMSASPKPETDPKPENGVKGLVETVNALAETVKALQAANVGRDVSGGEKTETCENILEKLINGGNDNADK